MKTKLSTEPIADSSLPGVRQMVRGERVGEDNNVDKMSLWLQSIESKRFLSLSAGLELNPSQGLLLMHDRTSRPLGQSSQCHLPLLHPRRVDHLSKERHNACPGRSSQPTRSSMRMAKPALVLTRLLVHQPLPTLRLLLSPNPRKLASSSKRLPLCSLKLLP